MYRKRLIFTGKKWNKFSIDLLGDPFLYHYNLFNYFIRGRIMFERVEEYRKCSKCREVKRLTDFDLIIGRDNEPIGIRKWCRECNRDIERLRYAKRLNKNRKGKQSTRPFIKEIEVGKREAIELRKNLSKEEKELQEFLLSTDYKFFIKYVIADDHERVFLDAYLPVAKGYDYKGIGVVLGKEERRTRRIANGMHILLVYVDSEDGIDYLENILGQYDVIKRGVKVIINNY